MSKPRTIEEVKNDIRDRVGRRAPFLHADKNEAEEALSRMPNFDAETWASAWNTLGANWEEKAEAAEDSRTPKASPLRQVLECGKVAVR